MTAHADDAPTTIRDTLLADHRRLDDALTRVLVALESVDPERAATEWADFAQALTSHLDAEDQYILPALFASRPRDARSLLQEHRHVRARALELGRAIAQGTLRVETVRGFVDELAAHVRRETGVLYDWADGELETLDRDAVVRAITPTARPVANRKSLPSLKGSR